MASGKIGWVQATHGSGDATFVNLATATEMRWQGDGTEVFWHAPRDLGGSIKVLESPEVLLARLAEGER